MAESGCDGEACRRLERAEHTQVEEGYAEHEDVAGECRRDDERSTDEHNQQLTKARAQAVMEAMMKMVKIDIAAIKAAFDGR